MASERGALDTIRRCFTRRPLESLLSAGGGPGSGALLSKLIPGPHLYDQGSIREVERSGLKFRLDPSRPLHWNLFWGVDGRNRQKLYSMIARGDTVLDIGVKIGETLLNFSRIAGPDGVVYGFEPDEFNFSTAQSNIALNDASNVRLFKLAISDKRQEPASDTAAVAGTDTIDNLVADQKIGRVDMIKIDIDGHEMHALRGAKKTLEHSRPKLFIEVGYDRLIANGTSPTELVRFLIYYGYHVFHSETDAPITAVYDFSQLGDGGIDVYAVAFRCQKPFTFAISVFANRWSRLRSCPTLQRSRRAVSR